MGRARGFTPRGPPRIITARSFWYAPHDGRSAVLRLVRRPRGPVPPPPGAEHVAPSLAVSVPALAPSARLSSASRFATPRIVRSFGRRLVTAAMATAALTTIVSGASAQATFTVSVHATAPGFGHAMVMSSPAGISCDFQGSDFDISGKGTCTASFDAGATVVLSVTTRDGTTHTGWSGDCSAFTGDCTLVVSQNRNVGVSLKPAIARITGALSGNGSGAVVEISNFSARPQLDCLLTLGQQSGNCASDYPVGSRVTFETKTPLNSEDRFRGFAVPPCGNSGNCGMIVAGPTTIVGSFTAPELHIAGSGTGSGRVVGVGTGTLDCSVSPSGNTGTCDRVFDTSPASQFTSRRHLTPGAFLSAGAVPVRAPGPALHARPSRRTPPR